MLKKKTSNWKLINTTYRCCPVCNKKYKINLEGKPFRCPCCKNAMAARMHYSQIKEGE